MNIKEQDSQRRDRITSLVTAFGRITGNSNAKLQRSPVNFLSESRSPSEVPGLLHQCKAAGHHFQKERDEHDLCGLWQASTGQHDALLVALSHAVRA